MPCGARVAGSDTLTVIDVTQAVGWKRVDLGWVDVTVAAVYKWLLAPRGTAWMSLSDRVCRIMTPHAANWYAGEDAVVRRSTGCRCDWPTKRATLRRVAHLVQRARRRPDTAVAGVAGRRSGRGAHRRAGKPCACRTRSAPAKFGHRVDTYRGCGRQAAGAGIRASMRAGAVRVGFHLYNTENDLDRLLSALGDNG